MKLRLGVIVAVLGVGKALAAPPAPAQSQSQEVFVAPGPGLQMLGVWIDPDGTARTRTCTGVPCSKDPFGAVTLATKVSNATLTVVNIGEGKRVVHVKATGSDGAPWEAVVAGRAEAQVLFSGKTGFTAGEEGERTGQIVRIFDDGANKVVMVADVRQDLRICDQAMTPLSPKVLDPKSLELRGATVPRLTKEQRAAAAPVIATSHAGGNVETPIGRLFVATGASSAIGTPQNLVDGDVATSWGEARSGDGHGEFVMLRSPAEVPITRLAMVTTPPVAKGQTQPPALAAPKKLYLVTNEKTFVVTLPEDGAMHPGQAYDVPLPEPIKSSCVSVVLEESYGAQPKPDVTIAELYAYSELEQGGGTAEAIAKELRGTGPRAEAAAGILKRAGDPGAKAVLAAYAALDPAGRARAIEVASSMACDVGAQVLIGALGDLEAEIARRARTKLERCGKVGAPALVAALAGSDMATRGRVAPILSATAASLAIDPLAKAMGDGPPDVRASIRGAFARAVRTAPKEKLAALLGDGARPAQARLDLLRASTERLAEVAPEAKMALEALLANADFPTRYLAMEPLAALAKNDAALQGRLTDAVGKDESWPVRARAAEVSATVPGAQGSLLSATADPEPRVREAAVRAAGEAKLGGVIVPATKLLGADPWTFVRVAAAGTLGALPAAPDVDASLAEAVKSDTAFHVRAAAIVALGTHKARSQSKRVIESLENKEEHPDVRIAAAHALGEMCETGALDALTSAARKSVSPIASLEDLTIATSAMRALGAIHPKDLASRLEPLLAPDARAEMKRAAQATIAEKATCP